MNQDAVGWFVWAFHTRQASGLHAVFGISQSILVRHFGQTQRLHAYTYTSGIHHHKHRRQALVGLTHQSADCAIKHHLASGVAVDAHLVL